MESSFVGKIRSVPRYVWILLAIVAVGAFLRTYRLHDWLEFRGDQMRDATIVSQVVDKGEAWPLMGPYMNHTGDTEESSFHLGPIYYYFQITAAKIFGNRPDVLAYPDVLFSILSLPLLYLLLRICLGENLSLGIVGLYAISPYIIHYSRYAWSSNPIPFLVLLFLYSLWKFLNDTEKAGWFWVVCIGFALGVGFQIHAILMILFPAIAGLVFLYSMWKHPKTWTRWAAILAVFLILNSSQILSEYETGMNNTKTFINYFLRNKSAAVPKGDRLTPFENDLSCHFAANFFFLTSYGEDKCSYEYSNIVAPDRKVGADKVLKTETDRLRLIVSLLFSLAGYALLVFRARKETDAKRKNFLVLTSLYATLGFCVMIPLSSDVFNDLRYYTFELFIPFLLFGLVVEHLASNVTLRRYRLVVPVVGVLFVLIAISDVRGILAEATMLNDGNGICSRTAILGEMEPIADHIATHSGGRSTVYLEGDNMMISYIIFPMKFLLDGRRIDVIKVNGDDQPADRLVFHATCKKPKEAVDGLRKIGRVFVYSTGD
ncbi:MAG: glycosyltransferase family 39 protein [Candidatus Moraniibacteriota bacterium]